MHFLVKITYIQQEINCQKKPIKKYMIFGGQKVLLVSMRNGRDRIYISKAKFMKIYRHQLVIIDPDKVEQKKTLKKTRKEKVYYTAHALINPKFQKSIFKDFVNKTGKKC